MVRTERLTATDDRNGMLKEIQTKSQSLSTNQIHGYIAFDTIAADLKQPNIMEYWKSSPYLLNFMDEYKFKENFNLAVNQKLFCKRTLKKISNCISTVLLSDEDIRAYRAIDPSNTSLKEMFEDVLDTGSWKTLWIPPALPYYRLEEPFLSVWEKKFTKRLVFSTWKVVPKAVSVMLSYEAERRMNMILTKEAINTAEARKKRRPLLRFAISESRETGMPIMSIIYPCATLALHCDPLLVYTQKTTDNDALPYISDIIMQTGKNIEKLLFRLKNLADVEGTTDERWYWAAPILLDEVYAKTDLQLIDSELSVKWSCRDDPEEGNDTIEQDEHTHFDQHVEKFKEIICKYRAGNLKLGKMPDDLCEVLSILAIAGPATCALRAFSRSSNNSNESLKNPIYWLNAAQLGFTFIKLFNSPDVTSMIRGLNSREPYWRRVLEYCTNGCLQSVLDEYVHILHETLGFLDQANENAIGLIAEKIRDSISLRTASLDVDNINQETLQNKGRIESYGRIHFSLRFGDEKGDDGNVVTRSDQVRNAFNSPFWPFVLVTTSIGQEGLDFHQYCHAVVHWNLPSNPVDLEQREGRIHRYKNHAVRKNLAARYGPAMRNVLSGDIWQKMFSHTMDEFGESSDDIVPFWIFMIEGGAYIERHTPMLPFSRDIEKRLLLKKSLAAYRMVFGQTRQEDLVEYLMSNFKETDIDSLCRQLRIDLSPANS